jgi:hypothetical protein
VDICRLTEAGITIIANKVPVYQCAVLESKDESFYKENKDNSEFYLLEYNVVESVESQPTFQRNISSQSSVSENQPSKKPA